MVEAYAADKFSNQDSGCHNITIAYLRHLKFNPTNGFSIRNRQVRSECWMANYRGQSVPVLVGHPVTEFVRKFTGSA